MILKNIHYLSNSSVRTCWDETRFLNISYLLEDKSDELQQKYSRLDKGEFIGFNAGKMIRERIFGTLEDFFNDNY